jgi:hypothetical protein
MKTLALEEPPLTGQCVAPARAAHRCGISRRAVKMLGELPAAVLDVVVQAAGEEHGWRLEVASASLLATSMECCAVRLGKCRWTAGDRAGTEFKPCWRHVAVALRRGPYYLLRPGGNGPTHMRFQPPQHRYAISRLYADFVWRDEADKFTIRPTGNGEGTIHATSGYDDRLTYNNYPFRPWWRHLAVMRHHPSVASTPWILHLGSHASHLPFRRCRMHGDGSIKRILRAWNDDTTHWDVTHWELAPATLADDERFEWRV